MPAGARSSLRPLSIEGKATTQSSGETRRESEKLCPQEECKLRRDAVTPHSVVARSSCDEAIQTAFVEGVWIASASANASADKSLRSQ